MIYRNRILNWEEDPFELIMFLRNLPKIAEVEEVIKYARIIHAAIPSDMLLVNNNNNMKKNQNMNNLHIGNRFWTAILILHLIYYVLSATVLPKLKYL